MTELNKNEIIRQDFVDNTIFELINKINPTDKLVDWNIEMIGEIRDVISDWLVDKYHFCKLDEFYP